MHHHILSIIAHIQQFTFCTFHKYVHFHIMPYKVTYSYVIHFITHIISSIHIIILIELWQSHIITYIHIYGTQHKIGFHSQTYRVGIYRIFSSFRELEHHHLIHLVHIMVQLLIVLKYVINALNLSYTCICQKCNAWTIFLMFQFLEFWTVCQFLA